MYSMAYGTLPIVRATGGLADTVNGWDGKEQGTGIVFEHADHGGITWALERALELYARPKAFKALQKQAMKQDFSWAKAAEEHLAVYRSA
jgi:starch synthase